MQFEPGRTDELAQPGTKVYVTTGDVLIDNMLTAEDVSVNGAMFKPGACTFWHSHANGQFFFVQSGNGMVATRDGQSHVVRAGDVIYTPPGEEHWHGAAPESFVTYTSISLGVTSFAEPVEDEHYRSHWQA